MTAATQRRRRGRGVPAAAASLLAVLLTAACAATAGGGTTPAAPHRSTHPTAGLIDTQAADPIRIRVPSIGINAPVDPLTVDAKGVLPAPTSFHRAGWWRAGPEPGERGAAVIVGHVDSYRGPAVFFRLPTMRTAAKILVDRADGSTVVFAEQRIERRPKDAFPTDSVYGRTADAQLRLITCGGRFDQVQRRYLDDVIVFARRIR
ncbi:class F sortase [Actinocatenispora sera]|uniref:class F sortase n=1 Tax=Actinocatenispora sera TaxID=390989 RepID=UPI00340D86B8